MQVPISKQTAQSRPDVPEPYLLMAAATMNKMGRLTPPEMTTARPVPGGGNPAASRKLNRVSEQTNPNVSPNA
jgi:hypothetical protein